MTNILKEDRIMKAKILGTMLLTSLLCGCGNAATTGQSKPTATTTATSTSTTVTSTDNAAAAPAADTQTTAAGGAASHPSARLRELGGPGRGLDQRGGGPVDP